MSEETKSEQPARKSIGCALLVDMCNLSFPCEDGVYVFPAYEQAIEFAFDILVKTSEILVDADGSIWNEDHSEQFESKFDALEYFQDGLDMSDYFHLRSQWNPADFVQEKNEE